MKSEKALIFLCSGTTQLSDKKLSHKIAAIMRDRAMGEVATLKVLAEQRAAARRRKMIFINECKSGCVRMLTDGLPEEEFLYLDVSPHKNSTEFNIDYFLKTDVLPFLEIEVEPST